jgi:hypothetical protein
MDNTIAELKARQEAEYKALVTKRHSKQQIHRLAIRHVNEFCRFAKKQAILEARQKN